MTAQVEASESKMDGLKWLFTALLVGGGIYGFYYFQEQSQLLRIVVLLVIFAIAAFIALRTVKGKAAWSFASEARTEVRKVVWPTRKETLQTTGIVMVVVTVLALFLWFVDLFLAWAIRALIGS